MIVHMQIEIRIATILLGIGVLLGLLALNKYVAAKYWLPALEDVEEIEEDDVDDVDD